VSVEVNYCRMYYWNSRVLCLFILLISLALAGCSNIEPANGTRVTFISANGRPISREKMVELSNYLKQRATGVLHIPKPRVESISKDKLILLLPGTKVPRKNVNKLIDSSSLEFYHLANVATEKHPDRPWYLKQSASKSSGYIFTGPNAQRVDTFTDPQDFLSDVLGSPKQQPVITGQNVLPKTSYQAVKGGWILLVNFDEEGSKTFYEFTKNNPGEFLAVVYNGELISAAKIGEPISGGKAFLTGFKSLQQAQSAAMDINTGVLPVPVRIADVDYYK